MRFRSTYGYAMAVVLAGVAAITASCDGDDPVASNTAPEIELATKTETSSSTSPTPPTLPLRVVVEFGVESEPPDPSTDYPEPMFFGEHAMAHRERQRHTARDTAEFAILAERLTDGVDESTFVGYEVVGSMSSGGVGGRESLAFTYPPTLTRTGPDLQGYDVSSVEVYVNELSTSESGGNWTTRLTFTLTIRGRER